MYFQFISIEKNNGKIFIYIIVIISSYNSYIISYLPSWRISVLSFSGILMKYFRVIISSFIILLSHFRGQCKYWYKWIREDNVSSCLPLESVTPMPNVFFIIYTLCTRKRVLLSIIYLFFINSQIRKSRTFLVGEKKIYVEINCLNHLRATFPRAPARDSVRRCQGVQLLPLLHLFRRLTKRHRHRHRVHLK